MNRRLYLLGLLMVFTSLNVSAQEGDSIPKNIPVTREKAIEIAKRKGCYRTNGSWREPFIAWDDKDYKWIVTNVSYTTTRRGKCKHTNGCTIARTRILHIDGKTGKILQKIKERDKFFNYE